MVAQAAGDSFAMQDVRERYADLTRQIFGLPQPKPNAYLDYDVEFVLMYLGNCAEYYPADMINSPTYDREAALSDLKVLRDGILKVAGMLNGAATTKKQAAPKAEPVMETLTIEAPRKENGEPKAS